MMENLAWQLVANGANGIIFYSLMDNFRLPCCKGVFPSSAHGCNQTLAPELAEANIQRLEAFAGRFMKHEELLVGETLSGAVASAAIINTTARPHSSTPAWPRVQYIVKRPRGTANGTNTTPTTVIVVNAMNATQQVVLTLSAAGGGSTRNVTLKLPPHMVEFFPV